MKDKKKKITLSILGILSLVIITIGVTYAIFTYTRLGTTDNTVTTGTLKFLYTENSKGGTGISITEAFPITDIEGKNQTGDNKVFDFKVEGTNTGKDEIPYEVTLRKKSTSTLSESNVKVYLTDMTEDSDIEILEPTLYSNLPLTNVDVGSEVERTLYKGSVLGNTTNYLKEFRLRMWIDEASNQDDINGKTFTALVNVYSNVPLISEEEIALRNNADISNIIVGNLSMARIYGNEYDYEVTLPEGTTSITLNVETEHPNSIVTIEKLDSLAYHESNIKRLSSSNKIDLTPGNNYFKVIVKSANGEVTKEYKIIIARGLIGFAKKIYDGNPLIEAEPTLTDSSNNTSDASGLYKSTATNSGNPTYYFRGNVENNYVKFAGQTWRIVRINEDGTIRMIMQNGIGNNNNYTYNDMNTNFSYMYYSNSKAKMELDNWYLANILNTSEFSSKVVVGNYFCEQAKTKYASDAQSNNANMTMYSDYLPNFKCDMDGNGYGFVNSNLGLISFDEVVFAGGYPYKDNVSYYLYNGQTKWTMSTSGVQNGYSARVWPITSSGKIENCFVSDKYNLNAVINISTDVSVTGSGTSTDPYVVQ